uniref:Uncharacterized protein n=1 Tax=Tetranychus urticae TaxID=32264 RepID=T1JX28_TETUR
MISKAVYLSLADKLWSTLSISIKASQIGSETLHGLKRVADGIEKTELLIEHSTSIFGFDKLNTFNMHIDLHYCPFTSLY